ncbi:MAG: 16S rRNA (adenine(1518)-N(6)/adenine(1519)-N(6))-dimethyltransferase RsmA, partial [Candidatus Gracilibacteria bacterium]|nr:16S rRNA (adenine(1518)-N(6)/adenine(1519)-N(6))-dimethyltransferase RsmA [Candidatus Gracilibacteria bacterium]
MTYDLSDPGELESFLSRFGLFAKKSFGQNFLVDSRILDQIIESAELSGHDFVLEIGSGPGDLSQRIAPHVAQLTSLEIDLQMIAPWKVIMKEYENVSILNQDVLDFIPEDKAYKVVANIPYYITSPILKHFLRSQRVRRPDLIVLLIQKEVAQRICDSKKPTLLSWEIRLFGTPEIICGVPPGSFSPSPKVDSAVLRIRMLPKPLLPSEHMDALFVLMSLAYKQPRKTLLNNLMNVGKWSKENIEITL